MANQLNIVDVFVWGAHRIEDAASNIWRYFSIYLYMSLSMYRKYVGDVMSVFRFLITIMRGRANT